MFKIKEKLITCVLNKYIHGEIPNCFTRYTYLWTKFSNLLFIYIQLIYSKVFLLVIQLIYERFILLKTTNKVSLVSYYTLFLILKSFIDNMKIPKDPKLVGFGFVYLCIIIGLQYINYILFKSIPTQIIIKIYKYESSIVN